MTSERGLDPTASWFTVKEVAAAWRVSKMTVYRLIHAGAIPAVRVGKSMRLDGAAVRDYPKNVSE